MANENESINNEIGNYLEAYGIHSLSEEAVVLPEDMAEAGYQEMPDSHIGNIGILFQQIPGLAANAASYHGTYRVYFDKSLGVLQQAKQGDGFLRANVVQFGTNNKITGQALLKAATVGPLIANVAFSTVSTVTGQYFLSEINDKLSQIEKKIDDIRQILENEKRSELQADYSFLQQVIQTFEYIQLNDFHKQATLQQIQQIRIHCLSNLNFYNTAFQQKKDTLTDLKTNTKKNIKNIPFVINEIRDIVLLYKFALYTYALSYYLEILTASNTESKYINFVRNDIRAKIKCYREIVKFFSDEMNVFLNETKVYDANAFFDICSNFIGASASQLLLRNPALGMMVSDAIKSKSDEKKKEARSEVEKQIKAAIKQCRDYTQFTQLDNNLAKYDSVINNSKLEIVSSNDKTYIKFSKIEDEGAKKA